MSRMSDMAQTIEELRSAAAAISDAADSVSYTHLDVYKRQPMIRIILIAKASRASPFK